MVSIKIDLKKRDFVWIGLFMILIGVGFVVGFGDYSTGDPTVMGHSSDEIMVNDSSGDLVSLQSYIDAGGFGSSSSGMSFGSWTAKDSSGNNFVYNQVYQAATDGLVVIYKSNGGDGLTFITDGNNPPTTVRAKHPTDSTGDQSAQLTMPVKKNDYWRVEDSSAPTSIYWIPIISGGSELGNCAWTSYGSCAAAAGGLSSCAINKVVNQVDTIGCSEGGCADITRCEKTRLYCCDIV